MEKYYHFAGVDLTISMPDCWMYEEEQKLLPFRVDKLGDTESHFFDFTVVEELEPPQGEVTAVFPDYRVYDKGMIRYVGNVQNSWKPAYIRTEHHSRQHYVQLKSSSFKGRIAANTVLNAIEAEHLVVKAGGFILHASYIEWKGKGILFTAPSGTGKSTQADLWHRLRQAQIMNGDRAVVRFCEGKAYVAGLPFSGSSSFCENCTLPLAAVVCLGQAPMTTIEQMTGKEAFSKILSECTVNTWNPEDFHQVIQMIEQLVVQVPIYYLSCTPDESAVIALEQMLNLYEE